MQDFDDGVDGIMSNSVSWERISSLENNFQCFCGNVP